MTFYQVKEVIDIHKYFSVFRAHPPVGWWFREQSNVDWELLPKAARKEYYLPENRDLGRFNNWKEQARAYITLPTSGWECLAIAQHYGLATRLLDWTYNPLIATYFAVWESFDNDGVVFCYDPELFISKEETPIDVVSKGSGFIPEAIDKRVIIQQSIFSVHGPPDTKIEIKDHYVWENHKNLSKIIIPKQLKKDILKHLNDYGINQRTIFPDLEGLSKYVNWGTNNMADRKKV